MKRLEVLGALLVFLAVALAIALERPEPPDDSLFGAAVALEPELEPLTLPQGTLELRGEVATAAGAPAIDAFVVLLRSAEDRSEPLFHAYTDAEGRFALRGLYPGAHRVVLTHPSAPPRTFDLELPAEGEVRWTLAAPLPELPELPPLVQKELRGRVVATEAPSTPEGEGLAGFEVALVPDETTPILSGACERRASTEADGSFTIPSLALASYRVLCLPPWARGGSWPILARGSFQHGEGAAPALELVLVVGALEGALEENAGRPLAGALVTVAALDALDPIGKPQLWPPGVTDAAGRFRVELLPPGRYRVHVRAGAAQRDVDVAVESGKTTQVPFGFLDPRAREPEAPR